MPRLILFILLTASGVVWAIEEQPTQLLEPVPDLPEVAPPAGDEKDVEPEVTIVRRGKDIVEEYRVNNRLYMVKIKPSIGPAYYLMDSDGDGNMDVRKTEVEKEMRVPQWVLFSW